MKLEEKSAGYPGFVLRIISNSDKFTVGTSLVYVSDKKSFTFTDEITSFYVQIVNGVIGFGYNNGSINLLDDFSEFTDYFDTSLTLGDNGSGERCMQNTTISNLVIKIGD